PGWRRLGNGRHERRPSTGGSGSWCSNGATPNPLHASDQHREGPGILSSCYARARSDGALPATAAGYGAHAGRPLVGRRTRGRRRLVRRRRPAHPRGRLRGSRCGAAAVRRAPGEPRRGRPGRSDAHRAARSRMGRCRAGADRVGLSERVARRGDRRDRRPLCQLLVLLRPGTWGGAGLLPRREPGLSRPPVGARDHGPAGRRSWLGRLGRGRDVGPRGRRRNGTGRARGPDVSQAASPSPREGIAYRAFATVGWLGRTLPTHTGRMLFRWAGSLAYHVAPRVRSIVAANQAMVLGRSVEDPLVQAATKEAFRRYARYWFDAFVVVDWCDDRIDAAFVWN